MKLAARQTLKYALLWGIPAVGGGIWIFAGPGFQLWMAGLLILVGIPCSLAFGYLFWLMIEPYHRTRANKPIDDCDGERSTSRAAESEPR